MEDKYKNYSVEDFAADVDFIQWAKQGHAHPMNFSWEQWLQQNPQKQRMVDEARELVRAMEFPRYPNTQHAVGQVWERITVSNRQPEYFLPIEAEPARRIHWWRWAAVLTGLLLVAGVILYQFSNQDVTYHTAFGETRQVSLPDGSIVTLNANSTLRLGEWKETREVYLQGEAFFSVRKQNSHDNAHTPVKFTVHVRGVAVNVLGTEFTVSDHSKTTVVLNEGKIELTLHDKHIIMSPGDLVEISHDSEQTQRRIVNPKIYSSWKDNEWILDDLTLKDIAKRIEETYGLSVVIKETTDTEIKITGIVPTDNLDTLLTALSAAFDLKFKREGKGILIE